MRLSRIINDLTHALAKNRDVEIASISDAFGQKIKLDGLIAVTKNKDGEHELYAVHTSDEYEGYADCFAEQELDDEQDYYEQISLLGHY